MSKKHRHKKKQTQASAKRVEKQAKNPPREKTRKEVIAWEATGITMLVLAFVSIIIPAILSDSEGHLDYGWIFLILFFVLCIGSLVILIDIMPYQAMYDMDAKWKEYRNKATTKISDAGKQNILKQLKKHGFKETKQGYYRKKKFSFSRDSVCYYVALADAEYPGKTFDSIISRMDQIPEKTKAVCRILFLYKDSPTQADRDWLRDNAAMQIAMDVLPSRKERSAIPVLVDSITGEGEYISKTFGISAYVHGCRLLRKYLK